MRPADAGGLKTVERALNALECVARASVPPSVRDVAAQIDHNVSSTYNIINTLVRAGYLTKGASGELRMGNSIALLGAAMERDDTLGRALRPHVEALRDLTSETVYQTWYRGDRVHIQLVAEGRRSLRVTGLTVGYSGAEHRRASGKVVMAHLTAPAVRIILERNLANYSPGAVDAYQETLSVELVRIRDQGFAFDDEDYEPGICCIAAPIFGVTGDVSGSVTVSAPATRRQDLKGEVREQVIAAGMRMSRALGASDPIEQSA